MHMEARPFAPCAVLLLAIATSGCTESTTSVAQPSASKCQVTATNQPASYPSAGGRGSVSIGATRDCGWTINSNASWIAIVGDRSGSGDAVVNYTVSENSVPSARSAMLAVDAVQLPVSQAAAPCTYAIAPSEAAIGAAAGAVSVGVTTLAGCAWTAASNAPWLTITSGASGNASGTVAVAVTANGGAAREGTVTVAGKTFIARQGAASASPSPPSPAPPPPPPPSPPPSPAPAPETVEFEGLVLMRSGDCPNIDLLVNGRAVVTNGQTEYRKGRCRDLSIGDYVKVRGTVVTGNPVTADRIEFKDEKDDH
jgi:uncharacterized protein DUF5666/all-beta uncharacterized protein/BACON domain-containing protein